MTPEDAVEVVPCDAPGVRVTAVGPISHRCPHFDEEDEGLLEVTWTCRTATLELHSLRRFLDSFDEAPISHERLIALIHSALAYLPGICDVSLRAEFQTGGLSVTVVA